MRYKIIVRGLQGTILTFSVNSYSVIEGFVSFIDEKTKINKKFAVANCEIQEVQDAKE